MIRGVVEEFGREIRGTVSRLRGRLAEAKDFRPVTLTPAGKPRGTVCIAYLAWPFREGSESPRARGHTNAYEVVALAEAWAKCGFRVVVGDFRDGKFFPPEDSRVVVDLHGNLARWAAGLSPQTLKLHHATGCHWTTQNLAELLRLEALKLRRGVSLLPRRQVAPCRNAELADAITYPGNSYTAQSYAFAGKPLLRLPISSVFEFDWPADKNFDEARRRFLWMGSYGMVHKGLDLVLEAFAQRPHLSLTICGRPEKEPDFFEHYRGEFALPNVSHAGWVSLESAEFAGIARTHGSVIYPSSSEGGGGAVIHAMHSGLLPVCTREASVDLGDFGVPVAGGTVEDVVAALDVVVAMSGRELELRARAAWEHVRRKHTRKRFRENAEALVLELANRL